MSSEPQTPDHLLAQWDRWIRTGERTLREMADALGLSSKNAAQKRLRRWRERRGQAVEHAVSREDRDALLSRLLDAVVNMQETLADLDDRQPVVTLELPEDKPSMVVFFGDTHIGGTGVDHRQMVADMELVRDTDGVYAGHLGDHADQFSPRVIPAGMLEQVVNPDLQWELVELFLRRHMTPRKQLFGIKGNHDAFAGAVGLDPCREMYRRLQTEVNGQRWPAYLGVGGRVWLKLGQETYKLEVRHDFNFKSSLNTTNSQRRLAEMAQGADVVALGHLHFPDLQYVWRGGINQVWIRTSTYKRHDAYAEAKNFQMGYAPPPIDMAGVIFWPDAHRMLPFRNFRDGLPLLEQLRKG